MRAFLPILYYKGLIGLIVGILSGVAYAKNENTLPDGFVYLSHIDPSILQEIRYAGKHNFIGRPLAGYHNPVCILTKKAAMALHNVQKKLLRSGYSLKVYDCYRPQMAVNDIKNWSQKKDQQAMKAEFFPRENKADLFKNGYVALYSGHSRGSTVDLTIVDKDHPAQEILQQNQALLPCYAPQKERFSDNSLDFGTGFDCLDKVASYNNANISPTAYQNRQFLRHLMRKEGFKPYSKEWWHFTLKREPFKRYFNFPVH